LDIFLVITWLIRSLGSVSQTTYYWQLKEYRLDRMKQFMREQRGIRVFLSIYHVLLMLALIAYFFLIYLWDSEGFSDLFLAIIGVIFLAESLNFIHRGIQRKFKRPKLTAKATLIILLTALVQLSLFYNFYYFSVGRFELLDLALILAILSFVDQDINALMVMLVNFFSNIAKKRVYEKARQKRLSMPDLTVIGITGSYGKTSVKEILAHILSTKYKVLKTEKNTNTEIGIANTIVNNLKPSHEIFVCEMGAYSEGEIKVCCSMAHPQIGIFTGLNEQHLALFGSLDKTFMAKWELISSLPRNGLAIFNGDSEELADRIKSYTGQSLICSSSLGDLVADEIEVKSDSVSFVYNEQKFKAKLVGKFQVVNLLMAIAAAQKIGLSLAEISSAIKTLKAPEKSLKISKFDRGVILDDGYNVNPEGLRAALAHLESFEDYQKILFFPGILELGSESEAVHRDLAAEISKSVDYAFFFYESFFEQLNSAALQGGLTRKHIFNHTDQDEMIAELKEIFKEHPKDKFVILFESRGADRVMKSLK